MLNLLKAELFKARKDKVILVAIIIVAISVMLTCITYSVVDFSEFDISVSGKEIFLESFSISNNIGIILPIMLCIIISREFSNGTIRNKIIAGHTRTKIYLSMAISILITGLLLFLLNAILSLLLGSLFFGYGTAFNSAEFLVVLKSIGLQLLLYSVIIMISIFCSILFRNLGISIVTIVVLNIGLFAISSLYQIPGLPKIVEDITSFSPVYQNIMLMSNNFSGSVIAKSLIMSPIYLIIIGGIGIVIFNKNDLK